ncbi:hypothetical protein RHGRI_019113 [Rhododendron griersonianum]|uniref:Uncharacterized protein n=1 Tax=Rhododendron griersonianum TaxID=479676 RepID=A0AAV6JIM7_9ERIC|nr:hypothetical protein RHGRI_019113 [Rhododendron griersonianum]
MAVGVDSMAVAPDASSSESQEMEDSDQESIEDPDIRSYPVYKREDPQRRRQKVYIGCGAGFGGDRPLAALKLLQRVDLNYIVLECLAERTLADRYHAKEAGGVGYDPRIDEWMRLLLPLAVEKGTCIITNMGAMCSVTAQKKVLEIASSLGISISVGVVNQFAIRKAGLDPGMLGRPISVYLGAASIVECLEKFNPNVVITSRVADAALFLAPMVYELGWDWDEFELLAQGSLAGHLLECGCQLTGGYFMHPGDKYRDIPFPCLLDLSLPYAEVSCDGEVCVAKADGSGGALNLATCAEQLLYEIGDPGAYITPDVIVDFGDVLFQPLSSSKIICSGAKPSASLVPEKLLFLTPKAGELRSFQCASCAIGMSFKFSDHRFVRSWMEEVYPGIKDRIVSYIIGLDSLKATSIDNSIPLRAAGEDIRLRMDGLFENEEHAVRFTKEFTALYTNGPAGGGGISTGRKKEIILEKGFIEREDVEIYICAEQNEIASPSNQSTGLEKVDESKIHSPEKPFSPAAKQEASYNSQQELILPEIEFSPAPSGQKIPLYEVAHSRAGDKGNDINFSIIPHFPPDIVKLKVIITPEWVKEVVSALLNPSSFPDSDAIRKRDQWVNEHVKVEIYEARGIHSLNVVVRNILDGGVNCSRRIDRHGKTISDVILSQQVVLPP